MGHVNNNVEKIMKMAREKKQCKILKKEEY